jgi:hypothetical protein
MKQRIPFAISVLVFVSILAASCTTGQPPATFRSTVSALEAVVQASVTAGAASGGNPQAALKTSEARATEIVSAAQSTQVAVAALGDDFVRATQQAFSPVLAELPRYNLDPNQGRPGWLHPPITLESDGLDKFEIANNFMATIAGDFAMSADITWNTRFGDSGCGFVLRSDGSETAPNQYVVIATRASGGRVIFATMANGEVVTGTDLYANGIDKNFDAENDSTNQLTVVGKGQAFFIYTNGVLIGEVDPSAPPKLPRVPPAPAEPANRDDPLAMAAFLKAQAEHQQLESEIQAQYRARLQAFKTSDKVFERGFTAFLAATQSGKTTCTFDNDWLWLVE